MAYELNLSLFQKGKFLKETSKCFATSIGDSLEVAYPCQKGKFLKETVGVF